MKRFCQKIGDSVSSNVNVPTDFVLEAVKKVAPMSVIFPMLGAGISYIAYAGDLAVSGWPWKIGAVIALACLFGLFFVYVSARHTNALWACGLVVVIGVFAAYYFFGVFAYFCYFLFAPMSIVEHSAGLVGGMALTVWWLFVSQKSVRHVVNKTSFVMKAFAEGDQEIAYAPQAGMRLFEKLHKERLPFPRIYVFAIYGLAPFCLVLNRILFENFGSNGVLLYMAALGMPVSLWFAGLIVRVWIIMVLLPREIKKERGKPVVVTA